MTAHTGTSAMRNAFSLIAASLFVTGAVVLPLPAQAQDIGQLAGPVLSGVLGQVLNGGRGYPGTPYGTPNGYYGNVPPQGYYGNVPPGYYGNLPPQGYYGNVPPQSQYGYYGNVPPGYYGNTGGNAALVQTVLRVLLQQSGIGGAAPYGYRTFP